MRILVIEDDRESASWLVKGLAESGHLADLAADGEEGLGLALEAVQRIDALFAIERTILGLGARERQEARQQQSAPLVAALGDWLRAERTRLSRHSDLARAMDYILKRWEAFTRFLDDGRICLSNNAAERALRGIALGRKSWLFAGSDRGGERAAIEGKGRRVAKPLGEPRFDAADLREFREHDQRAFHR
jgi:CheY-like chemotaxis protein